MKFEWKFGSGEIIATVALVFSAVSLWQSHEALTENLPSISVREDRVLAGPFLNPVLKKREHLVYARFVITNLGGRTVTLLGFDTNPNVPLVRRSDTWEGGPDITSQLSPRFVVVSDFADEIRLNPEKVAALPSLPREKLRLLNIPIESGATKVVMLGIFLDVYGANQTRRAETITVAFDLVFANGYRHHFSSVQLVQL